MTDFIRKRLPYDLSNQAGLALINKYLKRINAAVLGLRIGGNPVDFSVLPCGYMPLDVDTFAMDNSGTVKEHVVGSTYAGVDGYCPWVAYKTRDVSTTWTQLHEGKRPCFFFGAQSIEIKHGRRGCDSVVAAAWSVYRLTFLHGLDAPVCNTAQRRRIRAVIQELLFRAAHLISHTGPCVLGLGTQDTAFAMFERHWAELYTA